MFSGVFKELGKQVDALVSAAQTREFWIYVGVVFALAAVAFAALYLAVGFDPLTRGQLNMVASCRTGEGKIATIIIGLFSFGIACVFTLGEVVNWVEERRRSRAPGRRASQISAWRPILHVAGTLLLGATGFILMSIWCS